MNTRLVEIYVAKKLAMRDPLFKEARTKMSPEAYRKLVMEKVADEVFSADDLKKLEETFVKKYNPKDHIRLFKKPTVKQWIVDLLGCYGVDDILAYFSQETALDVQRLATATIGGQTIMRPALIWMVEQIETATGRHLTLPEADAPLAYLGDNVTLKEIAKYFVASSEVISRLRRRYCHYPQEHAIETALARFEPLVLASYRICADIPDTLGNAELLASKLKQWIPVGSMDSDWDLPIFWLEDELNISIPVVSRWVTDDTTVSDLVDVALKAKKQQLLRRKL